VGSTGLGLLLEEHRAEIIASWRQRVQRELGVSDPALAFAIAPLIREMSLALGGADGDRRSHDAWTRCAVLVRSNASPAQLAREYKLLHRCTWEALRTRDLPVSQADRGAADEWLDEALAEALDRLERVRQRVASFERMPVVIPPMRRPRATPPPLPARSAPRAADASKPAETIVELEPLR
jgi:hypothetical protein